MNVRKERPHRELAFFNHFSTTRISSATTTRDRHERTFHTHGVWWLFVLFERLEPHFSFGLVVPIMRMFLIEGGYLPQKPCTHVTRHTSCVPAILPGSIRQAAKHRAGKLAKL